MINKYYLRELSHLRELAVEFSKRHPALAPMLSGKTADPDVERLLEGTAFLSGLINQKIDDDFPEIIHGLMQLIFPHYLRPIPCMTVMRFLPKKSLRERLTVKAGCQVASIPVEGVSCEFTTSYDVDLYPLAITDASFSQGPGKPSTIRLRFELTGMPLSTFNPKRLRLFLTGDFGPAADRRRLLVDNTRTLTFVPERGGQALTVPARNLSPAGFAPEDAILPYPPQSFPGYRILQEYFILPEKFLFLDILGLDQWTTKGEGSSFEIVFELGGKISDPPSFSKDHFVLFAAPAINLFKHDADPILLDHRLPEYRILPTGGGAGPYQVYEVRKVTGFIQGTVGQREYLPFEMFNPQVDARPVYSISQRQNHFENKTDLFISVAYPPQSGEPRTETLSLDILCTNAELPERLQLGDVSKPTETSPVLADFENLRSPTATVQPPLGKNILWRLLSHLFLNYLPMASAENLRALLKLYVFTETKDQPAVLANTKRIEAVAGVSAVTEDRLVSGLMMRGQRIDVKLDPSGFASLGDMHLFGSVLDYFLASYAAVNCFTRLRVEDTLKKEHYEWPTRIGERYLL